MHDKTMMPFVLKTSIHDLEHSFVYGPCHVLAVQDGDVGVHTEPRLLRTVVFQYIFLNLEALRALDVCAALFLSVLWLFGADTLYIYI